MLKIITCSLVVVTVLSASVNAALQHMLPKATARAHNPCADIRNGQFVCLDCSTLAYCIQEGGDWVTLEVAPCATERSMYCNEDTKSCTLQHECFLPTQGIRFECQNPGTYPDPYDCKVYHICNSRNVDTRVICPSGKIYSAASQECVQGAASSDQCRQPQFRCDYYGAMGSWPGDDNIYYVCHTKYVDGKVSYYPLMYRCEAGKVFDGKNCVSQGNPRPPSATNDNNNNDSGCVENKLTAHPSNCREYYRCKNGKLVTEKCPPNTFFDARGGYCDFGNC